MALSDKVGVAKLALLVLLCTPAIQLPSHILQGAPEEGEW